MNVNETKPAAQPPAVRKPTAPLVAPVAIAPTQDQLDELALAELQVAEEIGALPLAGEPRPELSLDQALRRVSVVLDELEKLRNNAKDGERLALERVAALEIQKRDQEAAYRQKRKEIEDAEKKVDSDQRKLAVATALAESSLAKRATALGDQERLLLDKESSLATREANADAGFLKERREILSDLDQQLADLRDERNRLIHEITDRRLAAEKEYGERDDQRADIVRRESDERLAVAEKVRRDLADELSRDRVARLADVAAEVQLLRDEASTQIKTERIAHDAAIASDRAALEVERARVATARAALKKERNDLAADRELLDEDRGSFGAKVERFAAAALAELQDRVAELTDKLKVTAAARDRYHAGLAAHDEFYRRFGDRKPEDVLNTVSLLEAKNAELQRDLNTRLSSSAEHRLAALEKSESDWKEEQVVLRFKLAEAEQRIGLLRVSATELDTVRKQCEALETNKRLLEAALKELSAEVNKYTKAEDKRNPMESLIKIDKDERMEVEVRAYAPTGGTIKTLKEFADDLRHRVAGGVVGRTLYYSERDIRCFLGGVAMSRLMLLQGISGTGKTSLPLAFAGAIGPSPIGSGKSDDERRATEAVEVVEVQAGWRDRQDLIGYFNAFHRHYYATNFLQALYRAGTPAFRDRPFFIILDEINLSRVEQFFADFLSALEQPESKRRLTLLNDPITDAPRQMTEGRHLPIPPNVWFIGTANHDETTTEFADKTYDRAHIMELPRRDPKRDSFQVRKSSSRGPISHEQLLVVFDNAVAARSHEVEHVHSWLRADDGIAGVLDKRFRIGWGNRLEEQARRFVPVVIESGGSIGEAMDHLLQTRVLRKLRDRHDVHHRALEEFRNAFDKAWNNLDKVNRPVRCLDLLDRELRAKKDEEV